MRALAMAAATAVLMAMAADAAAQAGPAPGAGPAASAPRGGPGPGRMGRWGGDFTPGWALMTPQERDEHRARMQAVTTYEECRKAMDEQHQRMVERAKERGFAVPAQPRRDGCAGLKR